MLPFNLSVKTKKRWQAYVLESSWNRHASSDQVHYQWRNVLAETRREALDKILPDIQRLIIQQPLALSGGNLPPRLSVFVGEERNPTAAANRLSPYSLDERGNFIR